MVGYRRDELVGGHYRLLVDHAEANGELDRLFWQRLGQGHLDKGQYTRISKGGHEIWIEDSYNPVFRRDRRYKVIKFATDITEHRLRASASDKS
ncbi:PAS domain S-box protein [Rhizobium leguminosarum bv. viciae]|nr:PAS domain S-box protein [Rhizobium leguminosarum bv. viciae]